MEDIFIILILIILNGIFAMSEIAMISARISSLQSDSSKGSKAARKALLLQENPDKFLSSVQVGITLIGLLTGMFSGNKVAAIFSQALTDAGLEAGLASGIAQAIIIIIVTYLSIVIGELVPKRIGLGAAEKVAKTMAGPMIFISKLTTPVVWVLSKSTSGLVGILGLKDQESKVTEEEIMSIIQEGTDDGEVLPVEQDIVDRVFTLGDLSVDSIMTLRSDIIWLEKDMDEAQVRLIIEENLHEVYPVAARDLDNIIGILRLKDFVVNSGKPDFNLENMITKPLYLHENMYVYKAIEEMKAKKTGRALICDEFGKCSGIITHKDIFEALIGDMNDDDTDEEKQIMKLKDGSGWTVDGQCMIYDFLRHFDLDEDIQDYEYTTVAGLIIETLGRIPENGEKLSWGKFSFEVLKMDGPRLVKILVKESCNNTDDELTII